jgi:hypothetical protein
LARAAKSSYPARKYIKSVREEIERTRVQINVIRLRRFPHMPITTRHLALLLAVALPACGLSGCASINEKLAAGLSDAIPQWAGGLPADAPPRPGTAKYDEFMRERERNRLEPAPAKNAGDNSNASSLEPVH